MDIIHSVQNRYMFMYFILIALFILPAAVPAQHHPLCFLTENPYVCEDLPTLCPLHIQQARQTSTFMVEYEGYTEEAKTAFEFAVDILAKVIVSDVPIHVKTRLFEPEITNILGGGTSDFVKDFPSGEPDVWYASGLADALSGTDTNPDSYDIEVLMNRNAAWYFGTDGNAGGTQLDFVSVVLHELGHGIGFGSGMEVLEEGETIYTNAVNLVSYGLRTEPFPYFVLQVLNMNGLPIIFDQFLVNGAGQHLINQTLFPNASPELTAQAVSDDVFYLGESSVRLNLDMPPKIYAPREFINGSSISHLNEDLYHSGTNNALMTPSLSRREVQHNPGLIMIGMLQDMGWKINPDVLPVPSTVLNWSEY